MKEQSKLEKIINSVKETAKKAGKTAIDFCKDNAKTLSMIGSLAVAGYFIDKNMDKVYADGDWEVKITNYTPDTSYNFTTLFTRGWSDANEAGDYHDGHYADGPDTKVLETSSNEPGFRAAINAKPLNTPESDIDLATKNYIIGPVVNKLRVKVTNSAGLDNRRVLVYDSNNPNVKYEIPKDTANHNIDLPALINKPAGKYATWRISTPAVVPGDVSSALGPGKLDGKFDYWDIQTISDSWLNTTYDRENYDDGDIDYDGTTNFVDFAIGAKNYSP
jgi:hypothetical protein